MKVLVFILCFPLVALCQKDTFLIKEMYYKDKEVKGEITLIIKGIKKEIHQEINYADLKRDLHELIKAGLSLSAASKYLAKKYGIKKSIIYNLK